MRNYIWTKQFKRDFKKQKYFNEAFVEVLYLLSNDMPLPIKYKYHNLTGGYSNYRECHIKPNYY